jgi:hypothetical protein
MWPYLGARLHRWCLRLASNGSDSSVIARGARPRTIRPLKGFGSKSRQRPRSATPRGVRLGSCTAVTKRLVNRLNRWSATEYGADRYQHDEPSWHLSTVQICKLIGTTRAVTPAMHRPEPCRGCWASRGRMLNSQTPPRSVPSAVRRNDPPPWTMSFHEFVQSQT